MIPIALNSGGVVRYDEDKKLWDVSELTLKDLAVGISRIARFSGQTRGRAYTVAEHSVIGYLLCRDPFFLFHDVPEGLGFSDPCGPLKRCLGMKKYEYVQGLLLTEICKKFGVERHDIKSLDHALGNVEAVKLHGHPEILAVADYEKSLEILGGVVPKFYLWDENEAREEWMFYAKICVG